MTSSAHKYNLLKWFKNALLIFSEIVIWNIRNVHQFFIYIENMAMSPSKDEV